MKGTIVDFLEQMIENEALRRDVVAVASKHGFEFTDELDDAELEGVSGGTSSLESVDQKTGTMIQILSNIIKKTKDTETGVIDNIR